MTPTTSKTRFRVLTQVPGRGWLPPYAKKFKLRKTADEMADAFAQRTGQRTLAVVDRQR